MTEAGYRDALKKLAKQRDEADYRADAMFTALKAANAKCDEVRAKLAEVRKQLSAASDALDGKLFWKLMLAYRRAPTTPFETKYLSNPPEPLADVESAIDAVRAYLRNFASVDSGPRRELIDEVEALRGLEVVLNAIGEEAAGDGHETEGELRDKLQCIVNKAAVALSRLGEARRAK